MSVCNEVRVARNRRLRQHQLPATSDAGLALHYEVVTQPETLRATRLELRQLLDDGWFPPRVASAAVDVAHELVVNAHRHGGPPVRLTVEADPSGVMIRVQDSSQKAARTVPYRPGISEHGLGLQLVRHLAADWGQDIGEDGKIVWARVL
jgi:two-component sensor histidine kinase